MLTRLPRPAAGGREVPVTDSAAAEASPAQAQQQHAELAALGSELAEPRQHGHLAVVDDARATGGHPGGADQARDLAATLHQPQDLGVEVVDLLSQLIDLLGCRDPYRVRRRDVVA